MASPPRRIEKRNVEVLWLPDAKNDIQRLYDFLIEKNPTAAGNAIRLIQSGSQRLLENPEIGKPMADNTKRRELPLPFGASAYILRYRIDEERVVIIRVWHGKEQRV